MQLPKNPFQICHELTPCMDYMQQRLSKGKSTIPQNPSVADSETYEGEVKNMGYKRPPSVVIFYGA